MLIFAIKNDLKDNSIKNIIPLIGSVLGGILTIFNSNNLIISIITCIILFFVLFAIPRMLNITEFMGAGDIKIYMAIILLMGYKFGIYSFIYSIFIGMFFLLILNANRFKEIFQNIFIFIHTDKQISAKIIDSKKANIFSPYILIGVLITFLQIYILKNDWLFEKVISNFI